MNKRDFKKLFRDSLRGKSPTEDTQESPQTPVSISNAGGYLSNLADIIDTLEIFSIDYSATIQSPYEGDLDKQDLEDLETELEHHRAEFFHHIQRTAALINCTMADICAASGRDYNTLWNDYMNESEELDDSALLYITTLMHDEASAFRDTLLHGQARITLISDYINSKPIEEYREDPETLTYES